MRGLFNYDGPVFRFFSKVADCLILSILWLAFSLPLITIGASSTALYYAVYKLRREEDGLWTAFWHGFKSNFKQATVLWLILLAVCYILGMSLYSAYLLLEAGQMHVVFLIVLALIAAAVVIWGIWLFPCVARFENTTRNFLKNCAGIAAFNLYWSFILFVIFCVTVYFSVKLPMGILLVPAAGIWVSSVIMEKVFTKYVNET